ncbi:MAG: biopolymer transporter ExbD [Planctomycetes bacterium]|jgi:biopolymer transport protein TolR|nr:biopolymer transporter ExbD [Planctomycetota bacterium]
MPDVIPPLETSEPTTADLTPLMDTICQIIFLLLAILLSGSIVGGLPVNLPAAPNSTDIQKDNKALEVSIDKNGDVYVGDEQVSLARLQTVLQTLAAGSSSHKVFVRADTDVGYGRVAFVLSELSHHLPGREVALVVHKADPTPVQDRASRKETVRK